MWRAHRHRVLWTGQYSRDHERRVTRGCWSRLREGCGPCLEQSAERPPSVNRGVCFGAEAHLTRRLFAKMLRRNSDSQGIARDPGSPRLASTFRTG